MNNNINTHNDVMSTTPDVFSRFTKEEMTNQRDELVLYFLRDISDGSIESIATTVAELKIITGYDISIDAALLIRRLANKNMIGELEARSNKTM